MPAHKPRAPLTAASEARISRRAKTLLATASQRSYLDKEIISQATGLLLRIAEHTGETAARTMTRLRIPRSHAYLIMRAGEQRECARGDKPYQVFKRFFAINKTKPSCFRGRHCTCTQPGQRVRCGNYMRVDPANGELGVGAGRGALNAAPVIAKTEWSCALGLDGCECKDKPKRERNRCGNWRRDPAVADFRTDAAPWFGEDGL